MKYDIHKSLTITKSQSLRQYRKFKLNPMLAVLYVAPLLIIVPGVVGRLPFAGYESLWSEPGAYVFGTTFASGDRMSVLKAGRGIAGVLFILGGYFVILPKATGDGLMNDEIRDFLITVEPSTVAIAEMLAYLFFSARLAGVVLLIGAVAFGIGAGSLLLTTTIIIAGVVLFITTVAISYPVALALQLAFLRIERLRENKMILGGPLVIGMFALFLRIRDSTTLLAKFPVGWYADLALVTTPTASVAYATVTLVLLPITVVASVFVSSRLGEQLWLADSVTSTVETTRKDSSLPDQVLHRIASRPVVAVVRITWIRLQREPRVLLFGGLLIVLTASAGIALWRRFPNTMPLIVAIYTAATIGVGATLNPLGNEGPALPATLTTPNGGRYLLIGYALSAALPGSILVATVTLMAGSLTELELLTQIGLSGLGAILGIFASVVSLGIGVALPQFDGINPTRSSSMQTPRLHAVIALSLTILFVGFPTIIGLYGSGTVSGMTGFPSAVITVSGVGLTLIACLAGGWLSFQFALKKLQVYELDF